MLLAVVAVVVMVYGGGAFGGCGSRVGGCGSNGGGCGQLSGCMCFWRLWQWW